jgi:hypothetical protein
LNIVAFGTLTGTPIAGAIISANSGAYTGIAIWTGVNYLLAFTAFLIVRVMNAGWKFKVIY